MHFYLFKQIAFIWKLALCVGFATLLINCPLKSQGYKKFTLVIQKDQSIGSDALKALKSEFEKSILVDSISLKGIPYPIIMIEPYQADLLRYHLTNKYIHNMLKQELPIPVFEDRKNGAFYCKLSDYKAVTGTDQIDEIGLIHLESVEINSFVYLMQVANIYFKLKTDNLFYKNKEVYSISFNYKGNDKDEFQQLLELINKHKIKYEVVSELLSENRN